MEFLESGQMIANWKGNGPPAISGFHPGQGERL